MTCPQCGADLAPNLLACPSCNALVHAQELKSIAASAETASVAGNYSEALGHWRRALELLPPQSQQHNAIRLKIEELVRRVDSTPYPSKSPSASRWGGAGGAIGVIGLLFWKFKFLLVFVLTKAKLLLLGLTKASTFFSMLLSVGVYWSIWGWKFALGVVLSIYVHEMGHVMMLRRYGIRATAPMFIPGLGALIRMKQYPTSPHEEARVGLAGPVWGLGAAVASYLLYLATGANIFAAIAKFGAWINIFNLLPVWQLDGSHAFKALSKIERLAIASLMLLAWILSHEGLLVLLAIVAFVRSFSKDVPTRRNLPIAFEFAFLIILLTLINSIPIDHSADQPLIQAF